MVKHGDMMMLRIFARVCAAFLVTTSLAHAATIGTPPLPGPGLVDGNWLLALASGQNNAFQNGITAHAGGGQSAAFQLGQNIEFFQIDTVATTADSVALPLCNAGAQVSVRNNGANSMNLYASPLTNTLTNSTDTVNGNSNTTALAVPVGNIINFQCVKNGQWAFPAAHSLVPTTLTAHGFLIGEGSAVIAATAAGTANQVPISGGASADPSYSNAALVPNVSSGVDQVTVNGSAAGAPAFVGVQATGTDANIGFQVQTKGNGGSVFIGGGANANASLEAAVPSGTIVNHLIATPSVTTATATLTVGGSGADANAPMAVAANGTGSVLLGGTTTTLAGLQVAQPASRVNDVIVTPGATTVLPQIASGGAGADANIALAIGASGTGNVYLGGSTAANAAAAVAHGTANVNQVVITGTNTGSVPSIVVGGSGADANRNLNVAGIGTGIVTLGQAICTISGASPQTCNGQRGIVTTGTLTTAAATDASYTINNSSVSSSSLVICTDQGYSGTLVTNGYPVIMTCVPGSTTITVHITNLHSANALNGTVQIGFAVLN